MNYLSSLRPLFRKFNINPRRYASFLRTTSPSIQQKPLELPRIIVPSELNVNHLDPRPRKITENFVIDNNVLKGAVQLVNDEQKLGQFILDILDENPNHVAQIDVETGLKTTHGDMKDRSVRCALWLKRIGVGPSDIVVVCSENFPDVYVPVFASFLVDAIFNAWNCKLTIHTARRYLKQFAPKVIFAGEQAIDVLEEAVKLENSNALLVRMNQSRGSDDLEEIMFAPSQEEIDNFTVVNAKSPRDTSLILLSSGSTGFPKGVMLSSKAMLTNLLKQNRSAGVTPKIMWYSTFDWYSCISFVLLSLHTRKTRIIPDGDSDDLERVFQIIDEYKVNRVYFPPVLMALIAKTRLAQKFDLRSLDVVFTGGSICSKEVLECVKQSVPTAFIHQVYGTTETGVLSFTTPACKHIDSVGFVSSNYQVKIVDLKSGKSLGPNQRGEIYVKSPAIMIGYYNNPEETGKSIDDEGWYHTGDLGYYDETGHIFVVERLKEMMRYRNQPVAPAEIEEILLSHPDVLAAIVVALPHELDGDWPTALCKKVPGSKVTEDKLMELTSVLEDHKKLRGGIYFIDQFLYTSSGKVARNEMKKFSKYLIEKKNKS